MVFDIETIALSKYYTDLDDKQQELWEKRCDRKYSDERSKIEGSSSISNFYQYCWESYSALIPEYSKILCISFIVNYKEELYIKTLSGDEKTILIDFFEWVVRLFASNEVCCLSGHNVKGFDIPFILKRAMINGYLYEELPNEFQILGKKPWDLDYIIDTKDLWSFGAFAFKSSLDEVCYSLNIESPKDGIVCGENLYDYVYNQNGDISLIYSYCERDVKSTQEVLNRF